MMRPHSLAAVLQMNIPEREDLVEGLFPRGDAILFSAREKAGKGLFMMDCAVCIASGDTFLGRDVRPGPVVYLALEEGKRTIRDRLRARAGGRPDLPVYVVFLDGSEEQTFRLDDYDSIEGLRALIVEYQPVLVVLDVLREAHDGRENESDDMAILLRPIRQIAHEFNVTIVVTHHASKAGGFRGSTSIPAAFDDTIEFVRDDLDSDTEMRGVLTGRGRDLPKVVQHIEFDPETFRWRAISGAPLVSQPTNMRERILAVLNRTDDYLTAEQIAEQIDGAKVKTVQNKLSDMMRERYRQILIRGSGTKGDPRRYHGIHKRADAAPETSGNDPGINGHHEAAVVGTGNPAWDDLWSDQRRAS